MATFRIKPKENIHKSLTVPGDKSITHRAIILASLAEGKSVIYDYLDADDCRRTIDAFKFMGVAIKKDKNKLIVEGRGNNLKPPSVPVNAGNSGTTVRLLAGVVAGQNFTTEIYGDKSLSGRPMKRIIEPLRKMNVEITGRDDNYPPIKIKGNPRLLPIEYESPVASAQVKSCVLFAGMQAKGTTIFNEPYPSRDHTERMLQYFGANIKFQDNVVSIEGPVSINSKEIYVPGDFSSSAFFIAAGTILRNSEIEIKNVGINPKRTGLINVLTKMGTKIIINNISSICNEPIGDIVVKSSKLSGIKIGREIVPALIDEIPLIVLVATQSEGTTIISGAGELRVKESDRIKTITAELNKMGAKITELPDGFSIEGPTKLKGTTVESYGDHRIAMTMAIAGLCSSGETTINNSECVDISFPEFWKLIHNL